MRQIKSFNVIQTAKVLGALYFIFGLVGTLIITSISLGAKKGRGPGLVLAVLAPFIYGVGGFISTAAFCWLYNVIAKRLGGIEVEVASSN
jgi:hypothetical protein